MPLLFKTSSKNKGLLKSHPSHQLLIFSTLLFYLWVGISNAYAKETKKADAKPKGSIVTTAPVSTGSLVSYQNFIGTIYYNETSVVASQVAGLALKVNFDSTDAVKKGQILVELDHEILDSRINAVRASIKEIRLQLEKVNKDLRRYTKLVRQKNVSQQQYDEVYYNKTTLEQKQIALQADLDVLKIERKQSLIRAPYSGFITLKSVNRGEWVEKGGAIATLVNPEKIYILFDIPVHFAAHLNTHQTVEVTVNGTRYQGQIEGLIVQGDAKTRTVPLKMTLDIQDNSIFAGAEAQIRLPRNQQSESILVPRDAVIKRFGQDVVFTIQEGKAQMIPVKVQLYDGSKVSVLAEGLSEQVRVIIKGNERIFPGQAVMEQ